MGDGESKPKDKKGGSSSGGKTKGIGDKKSMKMIPDKFSSMEQLQQALREAGLESSNLIIGVDFTKSNTWTGKTSFGGKSLHETSPDTMIYNPYQRVIDSIGRALEAFDDDRFIPTYGFGDARTTNQSVFCFKEGEQPCHGVMDTLTTYHQIAPQVQMSGPTNFAPLIDKAIDIVKKTKSYHILIIIADGQVDNVKDTVRAITEASNYPLSIICVGVGDGPFGMMEKFDDNLTDTKFDNFQFVNYYTVVTQYPEFQDVTFAVMALQEIPDQYKKIKELQLL